MISFGSNWWAGRSPGRQPAWFNSAGLSHGRRIDHNWIWVGQVRFNRSSGFHPEFRMRAIGSTFACDIPKIHEGKTHLLVTQKCSNTEPDEYLVTVMDGIHGQIFFDSPDWSSPGVQPISISRRGSRFEAMLLVQRDAWIKSDLGTWQIGEDGRTLCLTEPPPRGAA
jgi:hypothetical protein